MYCKKLPAVEAPSLLSPDKALSLPPPDETLSLLSPDMMPSFLSPDPGSSALSWVLIVSKTGSSALEEQLHKKNRDSNSKAIIRMLFFSTENRSLLTLRTAAFKKSILQLIITQSPP